MQEDFYLYVLLLYGYGIEDDGMGTNTGIVAGILFVALVGVGFIVFIMSAAPTYNVTVPKQYQNTFNQFNESMALAEQAQNTSESGQINTNGFGISVDKSALIASKQMQASKSLFDQFLYDSATYLHINYGLVEMIIGIFIFLSLISIIGLIAWRLP